MTPESSWAPGEEGAAQTEGLSAVPTMGSSTAPRTRLGTGPGAAEGEPAPSGEREGRDGERGRTPVDTPNMGRSSSGPGMGEPVGRGTEG